jgi:hypothetical protein
MGVLDLSGYGDQPLIGQTSLSLKACPPGYKSVVSKYTGRKLCVAAAPKGPCPPGYAFKFYPITRKVACSPAGGAKAAAERAAYRQKVKVKAAAAAQKKANMISALRTRPALQAPAQALKKIKHGGPTGAGAAMALSAKKRLSGERVQTATMSPLIQRWTGVKSEVEKSGAGALAQKDYTPAAVAAGKGWMPGCKLVCPTGNAMGVRAKVAHPMVPAKEL